MSENTPTDGTGPRVVSLPVRDAIVGDMDEMERDLPQLARYYRNTAYLARQYYVALKEAGFAEEDALVLCSSQFSDG